MPKIKLKNVLSGAEDRICSTHPCNNECPLYKAVQFDDEDIIFCVKDARYDLYELKETVVELSEKDFPTNREWLESLSDEDLAKVISDSPFPANPNLYGMPVSMVREWLSQPCVYLMEEE